MDTVIVSPIIIFLPNLECGSSVRLLAMKKKKVRTRSEATLKESRVCSVGIEGCRQTLRTLNTFKSP